MRGYLDNTPKIYSSSLSMSWIYHTSSPPILAQKPVATGFCFAKIRWRWRKTTACLPWGIESRRHVLSFAKNKTAETGSRNFLSRNSKNICDRFLPISTAKNTLILQGYFLYTCGGVLNHLKKAVTFYISVNVFVF